VRLDSYKFHHKTMEIDDLKTLCLNFFNEAVLVFLNFK
jgi:hypothetical protein